MTAAETARFAAERALSRVGRSLPKAVSRTEWALGVGRHALAGPLNGQPVRQELFRNLVTAVPIAAVVETGTFRGATTQFLFHITGADVYTVEANRRFFEFAQLRLQHEPRIHQHLGDSRSFLRNLGALPEFPKTNVLFYLDAHWEQDLPLRDELCIIGESWSKSICVIDDFEVPGDSGYTFDDYGPTKRLCMDYLDSRAILDRAVFVPSVAAVDEGGSRRGCAVIVDPALIPALEGKCQLRRVR